MGLPGANEVLAPFNALLQDVWRVAPDLVLPLTRATERLGELVRSRGARVALVELPAFGKLFDKSLSTGILQIASIPPSLGSWKRGTFLLKEALQTSVYEGDHCRIMSDLDPDTVFILRTWMYLVKDSVKECEADVVEDTVRTFFNLDSQLRCATLDWSCDWLDFPNHGRRPAFTDGLVRKDALPRLPLGIGEHSTRPGYEASEGLVSLLDRVTCALVSSFQSNLDPNTVIGKHGPGAVADLREGEDKYAFPNWPNKLGLLFPYERHAYSREDMVLEHEKPLRNHEPPARLLAVPKSLKAPRLITSEPTAHQFMQQGLMAWIRNNLPEPYRICIDFKSQDPSRDAALKASATEGWATIDLSSASDRLSLWTVERLFFVNKPLLRALHATRTRWVRDHTKKDARSRERNCILLRKYAGQGNATTFPVQSIAYATMGITAILFEEYGKDCRLNPVRLRKAAEKIRVFGDDIIIPSSAGLSMVRLLEFNQLQVNWEKTHISGSFRESCGMDAWRGTEVTPHYMQALTLPPNPKPDAVTSWLDVTNNAFQKGLWSLSQWMEQQLPESIQRRLIYSRAPGGGLRLYTHVHGTASRSNVRVNDLTQQTEVLTLEPRAKMRWKGRDNPDSLLQYFVERPSTNVRYRSGHSGSRPRLRFRKRWVPFR